MSGHASFDGSVETFEEVLDFLSRSYRLYGRLQNWSINRFGNWRFGGNSKRLKTDPHFFHRNLHIWREHGEIIGVVVGEGGGQMTLMVHPDHRGLAIEMLDWVEEQADGKASVCCWNNDAWLLGLLREREYRFTESGGYNRKYDTSLAPSHCPIPAGFELTDMAHYRNDGEYIRAVSGAFGRTSIDREWYDSNVQAPARSPDWVVCVTSPEGRCAAFCDVRFDQAAGYAEIDPIGTHPDFQRRGLARACIAESFRRLHRHGIRHAYIGSAPEPAPSNRLYDGLRPIEIYEEQVWEQTPDHGR